MFMDALSASATTNKKDPKKRKRRTSSSKDGSVSSPPDSPQSATILSPRVSTAPLKFYQDILEDDDKKDESVNKNEKNDESSSKKDDDESSKVVDENVDDEEKGDDGDEEEFPTKPKKSKLESDATSSQGKDKDDLQNSTAEPDETEIAEELPKPPGPGCGPDGPPGVLMIHRRKGPKKQLKWKPQETIEQIRYFELDETERVNVTKTFIDAKQSERCREREAVQTSRNLAAEDKMYKEIEWKPLIEIEGVPSHPEGSQSKERQIQADRELTCLKVLYFNANSVPDSASEPDMEQYHFIDPPIIPIDDVTGNPEAINDLTKFPWPEPKLSPINLNSPNNLPPFGNGMPPFNQFPVNGLNPWQQPMFNLADGMIPPIPPLGLGIPIPDDLNLSNLPPFINNDFNGPPPFGFPNFPPNMNNMNRNDNNMGGGRNNNNNGNRGNWFRQNDGGGGGGWSNNHDDRGDRDRGGRGGGRYNNNNNGRPWVHGNNNNRNNRFGYNSGMKNSYRVNQQ